jgi:hypothetical protein
MAGSLGGGRERRTPRQPARNTETYARLARVPLRRSRLPVEQQVGQAGDREDVTQERPRVGQHQQSAVFRAVLASLTRTVLRATTSTPRSGCRVTHPVVSQRYAKSPVHCRRCLLPLSSWSPEPCGSAPRSRRKPTSLKGVTRASGCVHWCSPRERAEGSLDVRGSLRPADVLVRELRGNDCGCYWSLSERSTMNGPSREPALAKPRLNAYAAMTPAPSAHARSTSNASLT